MTTYPRQFVPSQAPQLAYVLLQAPEQQAVTVRRLARLRWSAQLIANMTGLALDRVHEFLQNPEMTNGR